MDNLQYYFKRARGKVEYLRADYTQKYYSNSRDPRVIHTKLNDSLVSLRPCPEDKYLIKPGEFLTLGPKQPGPETSDHVTHKQQVLELEESQPLESSHDLISFTQMCTCECHLQTSAETSLIENSPKQGKRHGWLKTLSGISFKRMTEIPIALSPLSEESSTEIIMINNDQGDSGMPQTSLNPTQVQGDANAVSCKKNSLYGEILRRYSFAEGTRLSSISSLEHRDACASGSENQVFPAWKHVINDVSLSAARISTGSTPTASRNTPNLTADFTKALVSDGFRDAFETAKMQLKPDYSYDFIYLYGESSEESEEKE
ncbi:hypothetical protein PSN45_000074 [Yamadazyma tenuis]|uniref:uncharacterized protein n=1 Tax=Candida tenuis TaxID=2315449 RepID=UPI00279DBCE3|nr:hypothetical protein PSN45_000074 [Yamadazyma tenuis]